MRPGTSGTLGPTGRPDRDSIATRELVTARRERCGDEETDRPENTRPREGWPGERRARGENGHDLAPGRGRTSPTERPRSRPRVPQGVAANANARSRGSIRIGDARCDPVAGLDALVHRATRSGSPSVGRADVRRSPRSAAKGTPKSEICQGTRRTGGDEVPPPSRAPRPSNTGRPRPPSARPARSIGSCAGRERDGPPTRERRLPTAPGIGASMRPHHTDANAASREANEG